MFCTDDQILADIACALKLAGGSSALAPFWTDVVARIHPRAYNDIVAALIARKYALTQIDSWDDGPSYERDLALFYAFSSPQGQGRIRDDRAVAAWDVRPQLKTILLVIDGVFVAPNTATTGEASIGEIGVGKIRE